MTNINKCLRCGTSHEVFTSTNSDLKYTINCMKCHQTSGQHSTTEDAINAWNAMNTTDIIYTCVQCNNSTITLMKAVNSHLYSCVCDGCGHHSVSADNTNEAILFWNVENFRDPKEKPKSRFELIEIE